MKRVLVLGVAVLFLAALSGCGKKQEVEELQPITMESLGASSSVPVTASSEVKIPEAKVLSATTVAVSAKEVLPLPPAGPYKPTNMEIQTALKNAGYYSGSVDGKIGPKSKKAIKDFQKANNLTMDGKVGPKTWEALSKYTGASAAVDTVVKQ